VTNLCRKAFRLGDVYINDAFNLQYRAHTSLSLNSFRRKNKLLDYWKEVASVKKVIITLPEKTIYSHHRWLKFSDKILIIENLLGQTSVSSAATGYAPKSADGKIDSAVGNDRLGCRKSIIRWLAEKGVCIHLPSDSIICCDKFAERCQCFIHALSNSIDGWMGLDIGSLACACFIKVIHNSKPFFMEWTMVFLKWLNFSVTKATQQ